MTELEAIYEYVRTRGRAPLPFELAVAAENAPDALLARLWDAAAEPVAMLCLAARADERAAVRGAAACTKVALSYLAAEDAAYSTLWATVWAYGEGKATLDEAEAAVRATPHDDYDDERVGTRRAAKTALWLLAEVLGDVEKFAGELIDHAASLWMFGAFEGDFVGCVRNYAAVVRDLVPPPAWAALVRECA